MASTVVSRRIWMKLAATSSLSLVLAACGSPATTSSGNSATSAATAMNAATAPVATAMSAMTTEAATSAATAMSVTMAPAATTGTTSTAMSMDAATMGPASAQAAGGMDALIAAAKKEGNLTLIALPDDWSNYGEVKKSFSQKYGITVNTLNPDGSSQEELEAIKANKGNKGPQAPDAVEVGLAFGPSAKTDHLIQPYKVAAWDSIPANLKDADGYYYGDYYGVMSMLVNKDVVKNVPQDWTDLLKPEYKSQVALAGDPRGSNQAIQSVYAAGLGSGGSLDNAQAGLDFMAKLNQQGNLVPIIAKQASFAKGETPIELTWDYLALGARDALNGNPQVEVVLPKTGLYAGMYVQAVSAYAPHPNAAKLWMEYLYSDEGTLLWLKGYVRPVRFDDMMKRNVIPADVLKKLPAAEQYAKAVFPSPAQLDVAKKLITTNWDTVVKADIKKAP